MVSSACTVAGDVHAPKQVAKGHLTFPKTTCLVAMHACVRACVRVRARAVVVTLPRHPMQR